MAKVSELIEQARTLEAQGESAKALAIYQHVLPHLEGMPAIKADLSLKAGDIMLKLGNTPGALAMYESAATQCALHGSSKGALTVGAKIQQAAPERTDVLLSLAGQMVKHGHAGPAVDVLIQHARQANLTEMLQELGPLAGRPSEDVRPLVQMLLDQPAPPPAESVKPEPKSSPSTAPAGDLTLEPMSLEDQISSVTPRPQSSSPPPLPTSSYGAVPPRVTPPPQPAYMGPPPPPPPPPLVPPVVPPGPPSYEPPPPPITGSQIALTDLPLDLSPPLPMSARETAAINLRASQVMREVPEEVEEEVPPRRPSSGHRRPLTPPSRGGKSGKRKWVVVPVVLSAVAAGLVYFGVLPTGLGRQVKGGQGSRSSPGDSSRPSTVAVQPRESTVAARPDSFKLIAGPPIIRGAPAAAVVGDDSGNQPPVKIEGLLVADFSEAPNGFRVIQRQASGRYLVLTGRPLADTVGEPAVGEVRMDSLPGDSAVATTNFEGYLITVRGVIAPAALQALLLQLVSRPH